MKRALWLAGLLLIGAVRGRSQEVVPPVTTVTVTANLVVLDVVVTNRKGVPVIGLTEQDFGIFEDGKPQVIKSFAASVSHAATSNERGKTILLLDELNDNFSEIAYSRSCLRKYLLAQKGLMPSPTMLISASNERLELVHGYSTDAKQLIKALDLHDSSYPYKFERGFGEERLAQTLSFLQQIGISGRGEKERKNLIWVGRGFPSVVPTNLSPAEQESVEKVLRQTVNMLLDARITVNKLDPTAMSTVVAADPYGFDDHGPDPYAEGVSFNALAVQTGGRNYFARNDLDAEIAQSVDQGRSFYTLSYTPAQLGQGDPAPGYRHVRVAVTRPDLVVQTKHGYYPGVGLPSEPSKGELSLDLWQASSSKLAYTGVPVHLDSLTQGDKPGTAICTISIEAQALTYEADSTGDQHSHVYIVISSFSGQNKVLANLETSVTSTIKASEATSGATVRSVFRVPIPLAADAKRLRIVVRDARSGKTGSVEADPDMIPKS